MLTATRLRKLLDYNQKTGRFTWRIDKFRQSGGGNAHKGDQAGTINNGYRRITIDGVIYRASRLAILWMTGTTPKEVDHANLNRADDRWINLRIATRSQNRANSPPQKGKTVPLKGVWWDNTKQKYCTQITIDGYRIQLGRFDRAKDAHAAYIVAARKYFRKFARFG